jgi:gas vesicle protein
MDPKPDLILYDIEQTRNSLTEKIGMLEDQVRGTVENARDTVENIKSSVEDSIENVKQNLSPTYQVEKHPWAMLGASVATGFVLGSWLAKSPRRTSSQEPPRSAYAPQYTAPSASSSRPYRATDDFSEGDWRRRDGSDSSRRSNGVLGFLTDTFSDEIKMAKSLALAAVVSTVGNQVKRQFPKFEEQIDLIVDSAAKKVGP